MADNRSGKDRRVNPDRRKSGATTHPGPEKRAIKYRRGDQDRREKDKE
jgi:hypothetical protein